MKIDDTIKALNRIYQSIDKGIPKTAASPDDLLNHLNDLYGESYKGLTSEELFTYNDVRNPSITLTIHINVDFDPKQVMTNMLNKLHAAHHNENDEIGNAGIVWSHGRYDFVCDDDEGLLRITHQYSHKPRNTRAILSITMKMIAYAKDYLNEIKKYVG